MADTRRELLDETLHLLHRLAGAVAGSLFTGDIDGGKPIEAFEAGGSVAPVAGGKG